MIDITKCSKPICHKSLRNKCLRYKARDNLRWQSYAEFGSGLRINSKKCEYFLENKKS